MSPISEPRKRVGNPSQKLQKKSYKWMYIALILIIMAIAVVAFVLLQNQPSDNNGSSTTENPVAVIATSMGTIKVELFTDKMPITTANFIKLVNEGFYSGLVFHRVIDDFMIQTGGFYPNGTQKSNPYGNIAFETSDVKHVDGAISMASTGAGVGGNNQFFICDGVQYQTSLDGRYAAFGKVVDGMDVVRVIAAVTTTTKYTNYEDWPVEDIIINSITIEIE